MTSAQGFSYKLGTKQETHREDVEFVSFPLCYIRVQDYATLVQICVQAANTPLCFSTDKNTQKW